MKFGKFCRLIATESKIDNISDDMDIPKGYDIKLDKLCRTIKSYCGDLKEIELPFIEEAFMHNYVGNIIRQFPDGDIPEGIINNLSRNIFDKCTKDLSMDESVIIKVLTMYLIIQN